MTMQPSACDELKNEWSLTCNPQYTFMASTGKIIIKFFDVYNFRPKEDFDF
jgi:hypothetical protein